MTRDCSIVFDSLIDADEGNKRKKYMNSQKWNTVLNTYASNKN